MSNKSADRVMHTEGPWVFAKDGTHPLVGPEIATVCRVGRYVVGVATPGYPGGDYRNIDCPDPEGESDARLIAAAPDLLAALKMLLGSMDEPRGPKSRKLVGLAQAAVNKAEGRW